MALDGILALDKPAGITSHDVVQQLRRLSGQRRVGHVGTLDPLATGLLLICFGRSTRLVEYLMDRPKRYTATIRLGQTTDTYDAEGSITQERPVLVSSAEIAAALASFRGTIQQYAPIYSAIKRDGTPLYKLAREGKEVERPLREVTFYDLTLDSWQNPFLIVDAHCSAGTYIRSLAHDLGEALGCGGHIAALRRTAIGDVTVAQAVPLAELDAPQLAARLVPGHMAVAHLPRLTFPAEEAQQLLLGQRLSLNPEAPESALPQGSPVRAYGSEDTFLGILIVRDETWQPHKIFLTPQEFAF
jgi:tRNA pseudouridine55 synthase